MNWKRLLGLVCVVVVLVFLLTPLFVGKHYQGVFQSLTTNQMFELKRILAAYNKAHNSWPNSLDELMGNNSCSNEVATLRTDFWGHVIIFQPFDSAKGYGAVISYGRDGQPGGTGEDADLEVRFGENR